MYVHCPILNTFRNGRKHLKRGNCSTNLLLEYENDSYIESKRIENMIRNCLILRLFEYNMLRTDYYTAFDSIAG